MRFVEGRTKKGAGKARKKKPEKIRKIRGKECQKQKSTLSAFFLASTTSLFFVSYI
jgi:hypothetical protein